MNLKQMLCFLVFSISGLIIIGNRMGDINQELTMSNECDFRVFSVANENEQQQKIKKFKTESKMCAFLVLHSTSLPNQWTIAIKNQEAEFKLLLIDDPKTELFVELKKGVVNKNKIINLVSLKLDDSLLSVIVKEDNVLFDKLMQSPDKIIQFQKSTYHINIPKKEYALLEDLQNLPHCTAYEAANKEKNELVKSLYTTVAGNELLKEIRLWNQTHYFGAIRDNSRVESIWGMDGTAKQGQYVSEKFGCVHDGKLEPDFDTWMTAYTKDGETTFHKQFYLQQQQNISIQVLGDVKSISPKPEKKGKLLCDGEAMQYEYILPPGMTTITIVLKPITSTEDKVSGIRIYRDNDRLVLAQRKNTENKYQRDYTILTKDGLLLSKNGKNTALTGEVGLTGLIGQVNSPYTLSGIVAASGKDKVKLTIDSRYQQIAQDTLTQEMSDLQQRWSNNIQLEKQLSPLRRASVVLLDVDSGEILAVAGFPQPPTDITLWDRVSFQKIYQSLSPFRIHAWQGLDKAYAPGSTFKPITALAGLSSTDDSVIAFLKATRIKDAGLSSSCAAYAPESGTCYPATGIPSLSPPIRNFKKQSFDSFIRNSSSIRGNVFELAVQKSINVYFLHLAMLLDGQKAENYDQKNQDRIYGQAKIEKPLILLHQMTHELGFDAKGYIDLGLGVLDRHRVKPTFKTCEDVSLQKCKDIYNKDLGYMLTEGDNLYAQTGKLSSVTNIHGLKKMLAYNAIGQGVVASPLQMSRVAASIAENRLVTPYIIESDHQEVGHENGNEILDHHRSNMLLKDERKMKKLHKAMNLIPRPGGTAGTAFRGFAHIDHIYVKTGTAEFKVLKKWNEVCDGQKIDLKKCMEPLNSAWFTGWQSDAVKRSSNNKTIPKIAFACMISHTSNKNKPHTGGGVCAPIIRKILDKINTLPLIIKNIK